MKKIDLLKEAKALNPEDVFDIKNGVIIGVKDKRQVYRYLNDFDEKNNKMIYRDSDKSYKVDDKVAKFIKQQIEQHKKERDDVQEDGKPHGANISEREFETFGESVAYTILLGNNMELEKVKADITKTGLKLEQIEKKITLENLKEKIKLGFDEIEFPDSYFNSRTVSFFLTDMARRQAYRTAEKNKKLKSDVKYTEGEGNEASYKPIIETDEATKGQYDKSYNAFRNAFASGVKEGSEKVSKGGKVQDPITKKTCDVKPNFAASIKTALADGLDAMGGIAKDLLGLEKKDIISRMIMYGLNKKKLSDLLRSGTKEIRKAGKNSKNKNVKKHNQETIKLCEEEAKSLKEAEEKEQDSAATAAVKKSVNENLSNIIYKLNNFVAMTDGSADEGVFLIHDDKKFSLYPQNGKLEKPLAEHYRKLLLTAVNLYLELYEKGIKKAKKWRTLSVSDKNSNQQLNWKNEAFTSVLESDFTTEPDVKQEIKKYKEFFDILKNEDYSPKKILNTSVQCEKLYETLKTLKSKLSGKIVQLPEDTKITTEKIPDTVGIVQGKGNTSKYGDEEIPSDVEKEVTQAVEAGVAMTQHVSDGDYQQKLEKTKQEIAEGKKALEKWMSDDKEAKNIIFKAIKPIEKYKSHMIPQLWFFGHIDKLKKMFEAVLARNALLNLLSEAEEQENKTDKTKELLDGIEKLLKTEKPSDFITAYETWGKSVAELFNNVTESANDENKKELEKVKDSDPFEKLCAIGNVLYGNKEENKEEQNQGDSETDKEPAGNELGESFKPHNFLSSFRKYLNERTM